MTLRRILLATTLLALPIAAQAQPVNGVYVAGAAGANWNDSTSYTAPTTRGGPLTFSGDIGYSTGYVILGSVGWGFGNGLRAEAEVNYRNNDIDSISMVTVNGAVPVLSRTGSATTTGVMANLLFDVGAAQGWPVHITLGGGIGYAWRRYDNVGLEVAGAQNAHFGGTEGLFAWQGIAGLSLPIRAVPGLAITAEYRYFATADSTVRGNYYIGTVPIASLGINLSNVNQSVLLGVRYNFGRAPAAPPVAAAPAPASSFIVFFDFNRYDLTARAREIVAQAAAAARSQQVTRIEVAGHTDTVGSAQYNQGLSQRRANSVAAELVRLGVPRQAIQTAGYGFSRPLVPTGPNVREPQNRRVEVVLR